MTKLAIILLSLIICSCNPEGNSGKQPLINSDSLNLYNKAKKMFFELNYEPLERSYYGYLDAEFIKQISDIEINNRSTVIIKKYVELDSILNYKVGEKRFYLTGTSGLHNYSSCPKIDILSLKLSIKEDSSLVDMTVHVAYLNNIQTDVISFFNGKTSLYNKPLKIDNQLTMDDYRLGKGNIICKYFPDIYDNSKNQKKLYDIKYAVGLIFWDVNNKGKFHIAHRYAF